MEKKNINTKETILHTALELFSQKGYSAVSIRDIGKAVGIKESSIYYHFKNKQDIFNGLLLEVQSITQHMKAAFNERFNLIVKLEEEAFVKVGLNILTGYFLDDYIYKFIKMLLLEQNTSKEAAQLLNEVVFETPISQNTKVVKKMMEIGLFKQDDAYCLAIEYYSPIYLIFIRYFSRSDTPSELKQKALKELTLHLKRFYSRYTK